MTEDFRVGAWKVFLFDLESRETLPFSDPPEGPGGDVLAEFSPDGKRIAFFRGKTFLPHGPWDLYVQSVESDTAERITSENYPSVSGLTWTPDGQDLVFSAGTGFDDRLWWGRVSEGKPYSLSPAKGKDGEVPFGPSRETASPLYALP